MRLTVAAIDRKLLREVWQLEFDPGTNLLDVCLGRLRRKIESDPKAPRYLQTVRGRGYLLRPD